jgi:hypothetical protein
MSLPWGIKAADARADNLVILMCRLPEKPRSLILLELSEPVWACTGIAVLYLLHLS